MRNADATIEPTGWSVRFARLVLAQASSASRLPWARMTVPMARPSA
jgi:hypothetical protein